MLRASLAFLVLAIVAGALGLTVMAGISAQIAWILFAVFLVLALVGLLAGRRMQN